MRNRTPWLIGAGILILTLWFVLVLIPHRKEQQTAKVRITAAKQQLDVYNQTMEELPKFLAESNNLDDFKRRLNSSLYHKEEIIDLFTRMTADASRFDLSVIEITPPVEELLKLNRQPDNPDQPLFLNIGLHLRGSYRQIGRFLVHLEQQPYYRAINSCHLRGKQDHAGPLQATINFRTIIGNLETSA